MVFFRQITTGDGSITLRESDEYGLGQAMHSLDGALSETLYIYSPVVSMSFRAHERPKFLSIGTGLGYNELMVLCLSGKWGRPFDLFTFEKHDGLRHRFSRWLSTVNWNSLSYDQNDGFGCSDRPNYSNLDLVTPLIYRKHQIEGYPTKDRRQNEESGAHKLEDLNLEAIYERSWKSLVSFLDLRLPINIDKNSIVFGGEFPGKPIPKVNGIFFDPYSTHASPEFWTEEFFTHFLESYCETPCFFSTYAATGNLRRALKRFGFSLFSRSGFGGKRQSTLACLG